MEPIAVGFAMCGSFCTHHKALAALEQVKAQFGEILPIVSETAAATDTRFGTAHELLREVERICDRRVVSTIREAEPLGPKKLLSALAIVPCTGNTLAKLACGVTDSSVTMAAKAHLRNGRPVVIALATNDGLAANARNVGELLARRNVYFVPFRQDDPEGKPFSLMADFTQVPAAIQAALDGRQLQPVVLGPIC
ncbi:MAG: dipicolinate synthase subunit B [Oscillospiraceae bacterium]|nr:dipicolinate synthase subunit B [Oscillospiraceae bacterium]